MDDLITVDKIITLMQQHSLCDFVNDIEYKKQLIEYIKQRKGLVIISKYFYLGKTTEIKYFM